jgi:hypothetical protein
MSNFSNKLDKALDHTISEVGENILGPTIPQNTAHTNKLLADFSNAADKASIGLSDLKRAMETSGLAQNKTLIPFMEQLEMLSENLKENGVFRKNFESVLSLPMVPKK